MDHLCGQGTSYVTSERERPPIFRWMHLVVDAVFSPVRRACQVRGPDARVGQRTDYERLVLEVWTNGSIAPEKAVIDAASTCRDPSAW
jgi:DNA-directed RNA polymerase subunit alpha